MFEKLTEKLDSYLKMGIPFYDCVVMHDGKCIFRHSNGYTDVKNKVEVTGKEIYNIYSCSKLIACTAALQLWEKGLIRLDDELCRYMTEFENMKVLTDGGVKPAENKITVENLFTMTAGFSYVLDSPEIKRCQSDTNGECPTRELMKYLAKEPLLFEPGYRWEYSLCHDVLAALVETVSGMTFGEYVKKNIFDVCGMENSKFLVSADDMNKIVNQYRYDAESDRVVECEKTNCFRLGTKYESGGAGCISTVDDYIKFLEAIRTYKLLKKETVDMLSANRLTKEQIEMPTYWVKDKRGFGLGQQCPWEESAREDFGWGGAAGAHYFIDRTRNLSVYLGTHVLGYEKYQQKRTEVTEMVQSIIDNMQ